MAEGGWPKASKGGLRLVAISKPAVAIFSVAATVNVCNDAAQLSIYPSVGSKCLSLQIRWSDACTWSETVAFFKPTTIDI